MITLNLLITVLDWPVPYFEDPELREKLRWWFAHAQVDYETLMQAVIYEKK